MLNILNIVPDEKFIDGVIEYHDYTSEIANHTYLNVSLRNNHTFKYISKKDRIIKIRPNQFLKFLSDHSFDGIIIHNLAAFLPHLVSKIPKNTPVMWSSWGMDIYSFPAGCPVVPIENLYHELTAKALKNQPKEPLTSKLKSLIKIFISGAPLRNSQRIQSYIKAIARCDFFSCIVPLEYNLIKDNEFFHAKYVDYFYYNSALFETTTEIKPKKQMILIGNSAAPTNNHREIFHYLANLDTNKFKIIAPLNYGADKDWTSQLVNIGTNTFGNRFEPITEYLPFDKYSNILAQCSHAVFYHERQQAMGNVYCLLENGCKLFLSENSITYKYLKSIGVQVYSIQTELNQYNLDTPIAPEDAIKNSNIVSTLFHGKQKAITELHNLYNEFTNFKQTHGN